MQRSEQEEECEEVSYMIISPCRFHHRSFAIAGVNLQSAWVGGAHLVGDDNGRPMLQAGLLHSPWPAAEY